MTGTLDRNVVERIVRQVVYDRFATGVQNKVPPPRLVVNISARHIHLTQQDLEVLYGGLEAHRLQAALSGRRIRIESDADAHWAAAADHLRSPVLGPCRNYSQVELSFTDAVSLGLDLPVRKSGNHTDTPGIYLQGPEGILELKGRDPADDTSTWATTTSATTA